MAEAQYIIVIVQGTVHSTEGAGLIYLCGRGRAWRDTHKAWKSGFELTTHDILFVMTPSALLE